MQTIMVEPRDFFQALSDQTRIRVVRLLVENKEEACLCEIADSLDEPEYKLSKHIKILKQSGLLLTERDGRWIYHRLNLSDRHLDSLFKFIRDLPDESKLFKADAKRFKTRKLLRKDGRCRTEATSGEN